MSEKVLISVCIPAHNEARTIARAVESVLESSAENYDVGVRQVLVGANACTDNTADVITALQHRHHARIQLLEIPQKGKPNAWNALTETAESEYVVFMDGDVEVDHRAIGELIELLRTRDDFILAQSVNAAVLQDCTWLTRMSKPRPNRAGGIYVKERQDHTCGRLYAFRKSRLKAVMAEFGFDRMPEDLIHEDGWIRRLLDTAASRDREIPLEKVIHGEGRYWAVRPTAYVYFVPHEWTDDVSMTLRTLHAREQLRNAFPEYAAALRRLQQSSRVERSSARRLDHLLRMSPTDGMRYILGRLMKLRASTIAHRRYKADQAAGRAMSARTFARSESSKRSVKGSETVPS